MSDWSGATAPSGQRFVFADSGDGTAVVFLHGFPDTPHSWERIASAVVAAGYRAIRPWLRGYHPDTIVAGRGYDPLTTAHDPVELLDALGLDRAVLVGHDWGAAVTYAASSVAPQRFHAIVPIAIPHPSLLPRDPGTLWAARHFVGFKMPWAEAMTRRNDFGYLDTLYTRWAPNWTGPVRDESLRNVKECFREPRSLTGALAYYRALSPKTPRELLRPADVRALVVGGTNDIVPAALFAKTAERMADGSESLMIERAGHWPHREGEDEFIARLISFLASVPGAPSRVKPDSAGDRVVQEMYDRQHVESVLKRAGAPNDRLNAILDEIDFPIGLDALQAVLAPLGITHDFLIDRMGGSP